MKGWQALQLIEVCRLPQRPSDVLQMRASGYGPKARLAFDVACVSFANQFERMRDETVERPAPEMKHRKPTVLAPKYSHRELLGFLGIEVKDRDAAAAMATGQGWMPVGDDDWAAVWGDEGAGEGD
jgi:hypothetical protein